MKWFPSRRIFCFFSALIILGAPAPAALPVYDFTQPGGVPGWQAGNDVAPLTASPDGLVVTITGSDPQLLGPAANFSSATPLYLRLRLRSEAGGLGQLFCHQRTILPANTQEFAVPAGEWFETALALPPMGEGWRLRFDPPGTNGQCVIAFARVEAAGSAGVTGVSASATELTLTLKGRGAVSLAELAPNETLAAAARAPVILKTNLNGTLKLRLPRFAGARDRLYSSFVALQSHPRFGASPLGVAQFVGEFSGVSRDETPFPRPASKKGLQVQLVDDALALGIKHATLNFNLAALIQTRPSAGSMDWVMDGETYHFNRAYLEHLPVKKLSDAGVVVTLIMLHYTGGNPAADAFMRHPNYSAEAPNRLTAFNTVTPEGLRHFRAAMEFVADYYSGGDAAHGRVWGYIIGNEVNAHWEWYNLGRANRDQLVDDYLRTVRVANTAVRRSSANGRVYLSLTHFWNQVMAGPDRSCRGRELIDEFNRRGRLGGDFDWNLAFHPYPENLFEPRTWLDRQPTPSPDTPKITFKNLEVLDAYFRRPELQWHSWPRRIILSEQGFHTVERPEGELWQAAAYCYAYEKVARLGGIDAFILHRHVDHSREGGLQLGLWSRRPGTVSEPGHQRQIYGVFKLADTPEREKAFAFALPVIGITNWSQVLP